MYSFFHFQVAASEKLTKDEKKRVTEQKFLSKAVSATKVEAVVAPPNEKPSQQRGEIASLKQKMVNQNLQSQT